MINPDEPVTRRELYRILGTLQHNSYPGIYWWQLELIREWLGVPENEASVGFNGEQSK